MRVDVARVGWVQALVDTGACVSMIREGQLPSTMKWMIKPWGKQALCDAGGGPLVQCGSLSLSIRYKETVVEVPHVAVVRECAYPMLLGRDFLKRARAIVNCGTGELQCSSESISARTSFSPRSSVVLESIPEEIEPEGESFEGVVCALSAIESMDLDSCGQPETYTTSASQRHLCVSKQVIRLRPNAEEGVSTRTSRFVPFFVGLGEGSELVVEAKLHHRVGREWITPRCVCKVEDKRVYVPVTNPTNRWLRLKPPDCKIRAHIVISGDISSPHGVSPNCCVVAKASCDNDIVSRAKLGEQLTEREKEEVRQLLERHRRCFQSGELPVAHLANQTFTHRIDTGTSPPVHVGPRRMAAAERKVVREQVAEMLDLDVVEPANGPWSSPVVLAKKKDGSIRFCVDYRAVNDVTIKDVYPLPRVDDVIECLSGSSYFSTLDLFKGYWQMWLDEASRPKTAFVTPDGLFQFKRMGFGLCNAPASFQRMIDTVLATLKWQICLVYMDDILVFSKTFVEHLDRLEQVLDAIEAAGLLLQLKKCSFASDRTVYLGHVISKEGIAPDPLKFQGVAQLPVPTTVREVRRFLGMASYYRRFIKGFAEIASPMTSSAFEKGRCLEMGSTGGRIILVSCSETCVGPSAGTLG